MTCDSKINLYGNEERERMVQPGQQHLIVTEKVDDKFNLLQRILFFEIYKRGLLSYWECSALQMLPTMVHGQAFRIIT